jgi:hypothetical protein
MPDVLIVVWAPVSPLFEVKGDAISRALIS